MDTASDRILGAGLEAQTEEELDDCYQQLMEHSDRTREEKGLTPLRYKGYQTLVPPSVQRLIASNGNIKCNHVGAKVLEAWQNPVTEPLFDQWFVDDGDCKRIREAVLQQTKQRHMVQVVLFPPLLIRSQDQGVLYFDMHGKIPNQQEGQPPGLIVFFEEGPIIPVVRESDCIEPLVRIIAQWYDLKPDNYTRYSLKRVLNEHI